MSMAATRMTRAGSIASPDPHVHSRPPMNRIDQKFAALRAAHRTALIPFVTAGDPAVDATVPVLHALVRAGADVLELGVPFSDPMADGPVIQLASERALERKVGLKRVLEHVREFRRDDATTPLVLMGYLNPVELYGLERFAADAAAAGVDGVLLVDCPPEEASPVRAALGARGLHQILLAAPTSDDERVRMLLRDTGGYLYYVSFAGVTGAARLQTDAVRERLDALRGESATPVAVGFGVRDAESACAIAGFADAVVIGSALVERLADAPDAGQAAARAAAFLAPIRQALDARG
jgi:tryptophan synthase alpha chain